MVGLGHQEGVAVEVDRVVVHGAQIAEAQTHPLSGAHHERIGLRRDACVEGQHVEVHHLVGVWTTHAGRDLPLRQHVHEVAVDGRTLGLARVDDDHAHQPHRHLGHLVVVGVVHEGAVLAQRELVAEGLAGLDRALAIGSRPLATRCSLCCITILA